MGPHNVAGEDEAGSRILRRQRPQSSRRNSPKSCTPRGQYSAIVDRALDNCRLHQAAISSAIVLQAVHHHPRAGCPWFVTTAVTKQSRSLSPSLQEKKEPTATCVDKAQAGVSRTGPERLGGFSAEGRHS